MTFATFKKFDAAKQIVYAEVYAPMAVDSQGDFMTGEDIEGIAHEFIGEGKARNIDTNHDGVPNGSYAVESFVAKDDDKTFVPGAWVLGVKVPNRVLWQQIEAGVYKAFSMEGRGRREPTVLKGRTVSRLTDVEVNSVSIVKRGANGQEYKVMKSAASIADALTNVAKAVEKMDQAVTSIATRMDQQDAKIAALPQFGERVHKTAPATVQDPEIPRLLRKRDRLSTRLAEVWERPDLHPAETEAELRKSIQKCEDRLYEHGHEDQRAGIDSNSAFYQRGGSSNFLQASASSIEDILGVGHTTRNISKSDEDAINVTNCLVL